MRRDSGLMWRFRWRLGMWLLGIRSDKAVIYPEGDEYDVRFGLPPEVERPPPVPPEPHKDEL